RRRRPPESRVATVPESDDPQRAAMERVSSPPEPAPREPGDHAALKALAHGRRRDAAVRSENYLFNQLIPYIGNKRKLLPLIARAIQLTGAAPGTFVDFFAGSGVVSRLAKTLGFRVVANDWEPYAFEINRCFAGCNRLPSFAAVGGAGEVYDRLNGVSPREGYVSRHLCPADDACPDRTRERLFYTRRNGMKIDAVRELIAAWEAAGRLD